MCNRALSFGVVLSLCLVWAGIILAVPPTMSYQGRLTDSSGNPVADGTYTLTFRIYGEAVNGTPLWLETHEVTTVDGLFTATLGYLVPISVL